MAYLYSYPWTQFPVVVQLVFLQQSRYRWKGGRHQTSKLSCKEFAEFVSRPNNTFICKINYILGQTGVSHAVMSLSSFPHNNGLKKLPYNWSRLTAKEKTWPVWKEACISPELHGKKRELKCCKLSFCQRELKCLKLYHFLKLRTDVFFLVQSYHSRREKNDRVQSVLPRTSQATYRLLVLLFRCGK